MKERTVRVLCPNGIHISPAGVMAKLLKKVSARAEIRRGEQSADVSVPARKLSSLRLPRRASSQRRASLCAVVRSYSCFVVAVHF